jgi:hypothetical protein
MSQKLFIVEISTTAVVAGKDWAEAHRNANWHLGDIIGDFEPEIVVAGEVKSLAGLPADWDPMCLPYGGDGETRLKDLLPETEPERDTRTIDMFDATGAAS